MKKITAFLLACCMTFFCISGCKTRATHKANFRIVTSFYPMYILTINLTKGLDSVQVDNMAGQQSGCLHDYQLQSKDMKNIEQANVFVINGAGMESFMDKVTSQLPKLRIINAGDSIPFIQSDEDEINSHLWVSITDYIKQVENVAKGFAEVDPAHAQSYQKNADEYIKKLSALRDKMHSELDSLPNRDIITFHEAFPYFAKEFNLNIVKVINREPDSQPSAKEISETIKLIKSTHVKAVFAEPQYPRSAANIVAKESGATVYTLDPAVTGSNNLDSYITIMEENLKVLKKALA